MQEAQVCVCVCYRTAAESSPPLGIQAGAVSGDVNAARNCDKDGCAVSRMSPGTERSDAGVPIWICLRQCPTNQEAACRWMYANMPSLA